MKNINFLKMVKKKRKKKKDEWSAGLRKHLPVPTSVS